ncbi:unnamed protein product [Prorocentrum cordatum]|uniref:Uncharacterized protein n=1 Tax=Prorocentrum cordatum TaxID=2364126 RepID=A0ABN9TZ27_9DINO|nr:unnamed protein product [Polarella glacialis]
MGMFLHIDVFTYVCLWRDAPLGLHWQARVYNAFILPTLLYVAQLEWPDAYVQEEVQGCTVTAAPSALFRLASGPTAWASPMDLWLLRDAYGGAASFHNLAWMAAASQMRVLLCDRGIDGQRQFKEDCAQLRQAWANADALVWIDWYSRSFWLRLQDTDDDLQTRFGTVNDVRIARCASSVPLAEDALWRKQFQATFYHCHVADNLGGDPAGRYRNKFEVWNLGDASIHGRIAGTVRQQTPRHQASRGHSNLLALCPLDPPRVHCAKLGCIWDRWTTAVRYQRLHLSRCLLCAVEGSEDSIKHHCRCRVVRRLFGTRRRLDANAFAGLLA